MITEMGEMTGQQKSRVGRLAVSGKVSAVLASLAFGVVVAPAGAQSAPQQAQEQATANARRPFRGGLPPSEDWLIAHAGLARVLCLWALPLGQSSKSIDCVSRTVGPTMGNASFYHFGVGRQPRRPNRWRRRRNQLTKLISLRSTIKFDGYGP